MINIKKYRICFSGYFELSLSVVLLNNLMVVLPFKQDKKKKYEPPVPTRVGKKKKRLKGPDAANKLPLGKI